MLVNLKRSSIVIVLVLVLPAVAGQDENLEEAIYNKLALIGRLRVESLLYTIEMIGPSRFARVGRDALPRVRRCMSIGGERAHKKGENKQKGPAPGGWSVLIFFRFLPFGALCYDIPGYDFFFDVRGGSSEYVFAPPERVFQGVSLEPGGGAVLVGGGGRSFRCCSPPYCDGVVVVFRRG